MYLYRSNLLHQFQAAQLKRKRERERADLTREGEEETRDESCRLQLKLIDTGNGVPSKSRVIS